MSLINTYTLGEIEAELLREIAARKYVYPRRIAAGKMKPETADKQMAIISCALAVIRGRIFVLGKHYAISPDSNMGAEPGRGDQNGN